MWPHAQEAARRLGVAPEVLIGQAAHETAWGKSVPRFSDGRSSHNLFGIKASRGWEGERVVNSTLEFVDGVPVRHPRRFPGLPFLRRQFQRLRAVFTGQSALLGGAWAWSRTAPPICAPCSEPVMPPIRATPEKSRV
ncbi:MAG: glucosaminidase domain-containing protein [Candidatus Competibacter sp.]